MRHRVAHRKLGTGHRASRRDAAESGDRAHSLRAHRDDCAEGEGAAAVRRAAHHDRQARRRCRRRQRQSCCTRAGSSGASWSTAKSSVKLFDTIAPRFAERPGGYTRILRLGFRRGDSAEMAQLELVGSEYDPKADAEGRQGGRGAEAESRASAADCAPRPIGSAARARRTRDRRPAKRANGARPRAERRSARHLRRRVKRPAVGISELGIGIRAPARVPSL